MPATFSSLPSELVARVFDAVDARHDYLALALTCKTCSAHIVPEHLALRELFLEDTHTETWDTLDRHPELAPCVRSLTFIDTYPPATGTPFFISQEQRFMKRISCERIAERVARLPRLKSLSLTNWYCGLFTVWGDLLDRVLGGVGALECLSLDVSSVYSSTKVFEVRNLRVLELGVLQLSIGYWTDLCMMLSQSPLLEELEIPPFIGQPAIPLLLLPLLPQLVRFSCAFDERSPNCSLRLLEFLDSSPSIVELRCEGHPPSVNLYGPMGIPSTQTMPKLPNLRRIYDRASAHFARAFLRDRPPRSVALEAFECMELEYNKHTLDDYAALDPTRLRVLHVSSLGNAVYTTDGANRLLERVAQMFPAVEELHLPTHGTFRAQRRTLRGRKGWPIREYPKLTNVAALFPRLRRVNHVDVDPGSTELHGTALWDLNEFDTADERARVLDAVVRAMDGVRERYLRLERVNGWLIEDGERGKTRIVQLCPARYYETWRRGLVAKHFLTRDGVEKERYRERSFVSRPPLTDPTPIDLCINSDKHKSGKLGEGLKTLKTALLARRL